MMSLLIVDYLLGFGVDGTTITYSESSESQAVFLLFLLPEYDDSFNSGAFVLLVQLLDIVPP